jgi:hypothetical protein
MSTRTFCDQCGAGEEAGGRFITIVGSLTGANDFCSQSCLATFEREAADRKRAAHAATHHHNVTSNRK